VLPTFEDYCAQIARLPDQSSSIDSSTLTVYTIGPFAAEVEGQLTVSGGYVLSVWELLDLDSRTIRSYSYELDRAGERVWWYDPTGHPDDPALAATHPHHKHVSPNIKHHRVPAPEISFTRPNLPFLIRQVEQLLTN
jgi:hypothetical protein